MPDKYERFRRQKRQSELQEHETTDGGLELIKPDELIEYRDAFKLFDKVEILKY